MLAVIGAGAGVAGADVIGVAGAGVAGAEDAPGTVPAGTADTDCVAGAEGRSVGTPKLGSPGSGFPPEPVPEPLQPSSTLQVVPPGERVMVCPAAVPLGTQTFTVVLLPGASEPDDGATFTVPLPPETVILQKAWEEPLLVTVIVVLPGMVRNPGVAPDAVTVPLGAGGAAGDDGAVDGLGADDGPLGSVVPGSVVPGSVAPGRDGADRPAPGLLPEDALWPGLLPAGAEPAPPLPP